MTDWLWPIGILGAAVALVWFIRRGGPLKVALLAVLLGAGPAPAFNILEADGLQGTSASSVPEGQGVRFRLPCWYSGCGGVWFNDAGQPLYFNAQGLLTTEPITFPLPEHWPIIDPVQFLAFDLVTYHGQWLVAGFTVEDAPLAHTAEPRTLLLLGTALGMLGWRVRRGR